MATLKAVRFDDEKHKDILTYIDEYRDHKGRKNESEAIRFLLQKGFEFISNPVQTVIETTIENEIKNQLTNDHKNVNNNKHNENKIGRAHV